MCSISYIYNYRRYAPGELGGQSTTCPCCTRSRVVPKSGTKPVPRGTFNFDLKIGTRLATPRVRHYYVTRVGVLMVERDGLCTNVSCISNTSGTRDDVAAKSRTTTRTGQPAGVSKVKYVGPGLVAATNVTVHRRWK